MPLQEHGPGDWGLTKRESSLVLARWRPPRDVSILDRLGTNGQHCAIEIQGRGSWSRAETCGAHPRSAGHDSPKSLLEALHLRLRAHRNTHVRGPDCPGAPY